MSKIQTGRKTNYRWVICAMLFFATTVNYLDRQVLSLTFEDFIRPEFHWTDSDYGNITGIFSLFYAIAMLFAGRFVDWLDTKKGYMWSIGIWSFGACIHAVCGILTSSIVGIEDLAAVTTQFVAELNDRPEIGSARTSFNPRFPQYQIDVDAIKCKRAGTSPKEVLEILNGYYGGRLSTRFNRFTKLYQVQVQADPRYRVDLQTLNNIFIRIGDEMAPISQFVTLEKIYAPENLSRFNMFPAISVNGRSEEGYSSGDAIKAVQEVAKEYLPVGYGYDFSGIAREEAESTSNTVIIFVICIVLIYLILSGLYESFLVPLAVILSVPFGLMGSFLFAKMMGVENNIYLQTGLIMLIGLLSKTAILITEFAGENRAKGMSIARATYVATRERFRPILMTVLTMVIGMIPLMFSTGVGANGNTTIGTGVVGGMVVGTLALLFVLPVLFTIFQWLQEKVKPIKVVESEKQIEEKE